jgi:transposase-like protein
VWLRNTVRVVRLKNRGTREFRSKEERRRIVEETLKSGASVALVAWANRVNANQVFKWRRQYRKGRLEIDAPPTLVPVKISDAVSPIHGRDATNLKQESPASSILIWATRVFVLKVRPIRSACELHWKAWRDDWAADWHTDLDRRGCDRSSTWFHWFECDGTDGTRAEPLFRSRFRFPRSAWRSDQTLWWDGDGLFLFACPGFGA